VRHDGALLVGTPDVRCDDADFSAVLAQWPTLKIDTTEDVLFSFHRDAKQKQKHLCIALIAPDAPPVEH
jgi:hypothetical protein